MVSTIKSMFLRISFLWNNLYVQLFIAQATLYVQERKNSKLSIFQNTRFWRIFKRDSYLVRKYYRPAIWFWVFSGKINFITYLIWMETFNLVRSTNYYKLDAIIKTWKIGTFYYYMIPTEIKLYPIVKQHISHLFIFVKKLLNIIFFNIKWILLAFIIAFVYFFFSLFYIQIETTKQIAIWFSMMMVFYLLMSTFNNFLNKYKYGKFTSGIQRFWKRTGMVFWIVEGFVFALFFYYFLNSSQEPLYMFDYSNLNQELLFQLKTSYRSMILLSLAIYLSFILILNNNFLNHYQNVLLLLLISLIIFYTLFIETYQFVYIMTTFSEKNWIFDDTCQTWILEFEQSNLRVKQQYFIVCLVAKYWHFIFIFVSWFFFLIRCLESNKINYVLMGYNIQNLIILYVLNLFCLVQWIKWASKKFLEITYYWFHIQYDEKFVALLQNEIYNVIFSIFSTNDFTYVLQNLKIISNIIYYSNETNLWKYI
jgi:hypothetical protein